MKRRKLKFKVKLTARKLLADKLLDLANLTIAGLVFGSLVGTAKRSPSLIILGLVAALMLYAWSFIMIQRGK